MLLATVLLIPRASAEAPIHARTALTGLLEAHAYQSAPDMARAVAFRYGLNADLFVLVMQRESMNWQNGQSHVPHLGGPNGREDSWGNCQIHLPSHPTITKEQALDPAWCFEWSAQQWAKGNAWMWTEWRKLQ